MVSDGVEEEVVRLAVRAGGAAMVAEVVAEAVHEEVGIGFVVAEDLLHAVSEGDGAEVGVVGIVLLDGGKALAVDIADFHISVFNGVVGVGVALDMVLKWDKHKARFGEGVGDRGFAVLGENAVEVLHLLDEGVLLGDPDGVGEVCNRGGGGGGVVVGVVVHGFCPFWFLLF